MLQFPPTLLYAFGSFLVVFGVLRAYLLGWARRNDPVETPEGEATRSYGALRSRYTPKKHLFVGLLLAGAGLFMIVSTFMRGRHG